MSYKLQLRSRVRLSMLCSALHRSAVPTAVRQDSWILNLNQFCHCGSSYEMVFTEGFDSRMNVDHKSF